MPRKWPNKEALLKERKNLEGQIFNLLRARDRCLLANDCDQGNRITDKISNVYRDIDTINKRLRTSHREETGQ